MSNTSRARRLRLIGLIVLTVAVALAVGLTIYFVDKKDKGNAPPEYVTVAIGDRIESGDISFKADSVSYYSSLDSQSAGEGKVYCAVFLTVEGSLSTDALAVDGQSAISDGPDSLRGYESAGTAVSDGSAYVLFRVQASGEKYLIFGGYRIALGAPYNVSEG